MEKDQLTGIVKSCIAGKAKAPKPGTLQECVIIWVDYSNSLLFLSNRQGDIDHILPGKDIPQNLIGKGGINAKVLFKNESIFVCALKKGKNPLVYCPTQLHFNDFEQTSSAAIMEGYSCKLTFINDTRPIAVLDDTHKVWTDICKKRKAQKDIKEEVSPPKKPKVEKPQIEKKKESKTEVVVSEAKAERKRKTSETQTQETKKSKSKKEPVDETPLFYEDKTADKKAAAKVIDIVATRKIDDSNKSSIQKEITAPKTLTGIGNFWTTDLTNITKKEDSSEDEDDENNESNAENKPKKKLTTAEKFKQQRDEETRLREIEEKYADPKQLPDSVDQYDRLVLSDPNNSKHWINYMVFHLQSAEIDKARAVARRALKTITFRNSDDQINIWVALLNLELRYGSKETFNDTLKEALMYNEPLKIYLRAIEIITDAQKNQELIEMIGVITKKFKTEQEMWKVASNAYFTIGMAERGQQLLHKALACLPDRDRKYILNLNFRILHC